MSTLVSPSYGSGLLGVFGGLLTIQLILQESKIGVVEGLDRVKLAISRTDVAVNEERSSPGITSCINI